MGGLVLAMDGWLRDGGADGDREDGPTLARALADLRLRGVGA